MSSRRPQGDDPIVHTWQRTVTATVDQRGRYREEWSPWVDATPAWVDRLDALVRPMLWVVLGLIVAYLIGVALASAWCG